VGSADDVSIRSPNVTAPPAHPSRHLTGYIWRGSITRDRFSPTRSLNRNTVEGSAIETAVNEGEIGDGGALGQSGAWSADQADSSTGQ